MAFQGGTIHAEYSNVAVDNTTYSSNRAHFGGVMTLFRSITTICDATVTNNTANNNAGAIHADNSTINLANVIFSLNIALRGAGVIHGISSSLNSSGILIIRLNRGSFGVVNTEMRRATFRGFVAFEGNYGSFLIVRSSVTFSGESTFMNNTLSPLYNNSEVEQFSEGGALTLHCSTVEFSGIITVINNRADNGGAIVAYSSIMNMQGDATLDHKASFSGGAIYTNNTEFYLMGKANIIGNIAHERGGGMHATNTITKMSARGSLSFRGNSAWRGGGAYFEEHSKLHIVKHQAEYVGKENPEVWQKVSSLTTVLPMEGLYTLLITQFRTLVQIYYLLHHLKSASSKH